MESDTMKTPFFPGSALSLRDQRHVLAAYPHRFTRDHRPAWASRPDCQNCPVQFASDSDWLEHTLFAVTRSGRLSGRDTACQSSPTWPDNPELRQRSA